MKKIALLVQDLDSDYFNYMVEGAKIFCNQNGYELLIFIIRGKNWQHGSFDYQFYAAIKLVTKSNVDGILLVTNTFCQYVEREHWPEILNEFSYLPFVSIGVSLPGIASVVSENKMAFKKLLKHLYEEHGRRRFALVIPKTTSEDVLSRKIAFKEFIADKKLALEYSRIIVTDDYTFEEAKRIMEHICAAKDVDFDALVTCSDDLAFGAMSALQDANYNIPEDITITGFDNQRRCEYSNPPLTSIDQQLEKQAYQAAWFLSKKIENSENSQVLDFGEEEMVVSSIPVIRKSCGCINFKMDRNMFSDEILLLKHKEVISHFHFFLQSMQASLSLTEFKSLLIQNLKDYGISSCVICLYDDPVFYKQDAEFEIPKSAKVLIAFNNDGLHEELDNMEVCPEKGMYPSSFKFEPGKEIVVSSLFNTSFQYGYVVYNPGVVESRMYELIFSATGIALASNRALNLKDKEKDTDAMTGVYNRGGFMVKAKKMIEHTLERGQTGVVIFGDMDHLKKINDELGHEAGDEAIKAEVSILKNLFRDSDVIGRLGGDEFAIVAPGIDENSIMNLRHRLDIITDRYNKSSGKPYKLSISLGVSYFSEKECDLTRLLKEADERQYEEKRAHHLQRM